MKKLLALTSVFLALAVISGLWAGASPYLPGAEELTGTALSLHSRLLLGLLVSLLITFADKLWGISRQQGIGFAVSVWELGLFGLCWMTVFPRAAAYAGYELLPAAEHALTLACFALMALGACLLLRLLVKRAMRMPK